MEWMEYVETLDEMLPRAIADFQLFHGFLLFHDSKERDSKYLLDPNLPV